MFMTIGVVSADADTETLFGDSGWGWDRHGQLWHGARLEGNEFVGSAQWQGQEGWGKGDVLELEVDFNHGTLTAFKEKEGEMEKLGLLAEGLGAHGELCWAVSVQGLDDVVSIARVC